MRHLMTIQETRENLDFVDYVYAMEVYAHGKASYSIRWKRHYFIQRLIRLQLREFQC